MVLRKKDIKKNKNYEGLIFNIFTANGYGTQIVF